MFTNFKHRILLIDNDGNTYTSFRDAERNTGIDRGKISRAIKEDGVFQKDGLIIRLQTDDCVENRTDVRKNDTLETLLKENNYTLSDLKDAIATKKEFESVKQLSFEHEKIDWSENEHGERYAVTLFSDAHIEETVLPTSVLGKNEYNLEIAKNRIKKYFVNLVNCINADDVKMLIFASLGDTITSYLHDENISENSCTPLEATYIAQNIIYDGLKYIVDNTQLESIKFIGIVGNHSRTTKKIQHSNGYKMSYEWLMYKNIERECKQTNLPIDFSIPESEMYIADMPDGKRFLFMHGFQISGGGNNVCGIYPSLNRLTMKLSNTFKQDHVFLGHFHSLAHISTATINGSIISWNAFAMSKGMPYEEPEQAYIVYDTKMGEVLTRKIYCK